jgi:ABC-type spermidine/putrescine transport system permease subunit I
MLASKRNTSASSSAEGGPERSALPGKPWMWLAAPYVLLLLAFLAIPLANLGLISFYTHSASAIWSTDLTLQNYRQVFDGYYFYLILRTLRIAAFTTAFCIVLGYPLAYFLARCSQRALSIGLFLLVMPLMVSTVIRAFGWMVILGKKGVINTISEALGFGPVVNIMYTETAVVIGLIQIVLPLMVMPLMAALEKIPLYLEEASANLGARPLETFRKVLLPLSLPGLFSGILLCFTVSVSVVVTPALLGGRNARMIGNEIYDQVIASLNWPMASSLSMVLIALTFVIVAGGQSVGKRFRREGAR